MNPELIFEIELGSSNREKVGLSGLDDPSFGGRHDEAERRRHPRGSRHRHVRRKCRFCNRLLQHRFD